MDAQLDSIPVANLTDRYGVARSNIYNRLSALKIEPEKQGNKAFINADQLALMDALDQHLKAGGKLSDFNQSGGLSYVSQDKPDLSYRSQDTMDITPEPIGLGWFGVIDAIAEKVASILTVRQPSPPPDPLANLRALQEVADQGWLLSSSQLAQLLGVKPHGSEFSRHGFTFTKTGKVGAESAWKVTRSANNGG